MDKKYLEEHVIHGTADFPVGIYTYNTSENVPVPLHYHKEFELFILTEGSVKVQIENTAVHLEKSQGVFINSGALHSVIINNDIQCSFIAIVFSPGFIAPEYDNIYKKLIMPIIRNELVIPTSLPKEVISTAIETSEIFNSQIQGYELYVKGNITRMMSMCIAHGEKRNAVKKDVKSDTLKKIINYIHLNYMNNITLEDLSTHAHTSREHLCRIFRETADVSPFVYLNRYRIMQSAYMLKNTDKTISQISSLCGFNNNSYFGKMFLRFMNCTPSEYRRNVTAGDR